MDDKRYTVTSGDTPPYEPSTTSFFTSGVDIRNCTAGPFMPVAEPSATRSFVIISLVIVLVLRVAGQKKIDRILSEVHCY